eukprot:8653444-Lingulodinium_polyedra.AAC.1
MPLPPPAAPPFGARSCSRRAGRGRWTPGARGLCSSSCGGRAAGRSRWRWGRGTGGRFRLGGPPFAAA